MKTLADVIAFNEANPQEAIKFGQTILTTSQALDISPGSADTAAYLTALANGKTATRAALDAAYTRGTADPADDLEAILTPSGHADRHRRPRRLPAAPRSPPATTRTTAARSTISFNGPAYSDARLLAFGYAYERATQAAPPGERDRAEPLPLRPVPTAFSPPAARARPGAELLKQIGSEPNLPFSLETESAQSLAQRPGGRHADVGRADQGLPGADRAHQHRRAVDQRRAGSSTRRRSPRPRPRDGRPGPARPDARRTRAGEGQHRRGGPADHRGSVALEHSCPPGTPLVTRLRAAGAVILGKTNLTEIANFLARHAERLFVAGWSSPQPVRRSA